MKHPLLVLGISAIATFTMGWFGHRVFSKSMAQAQVPTTVSDPEIKKDSQIKYVPDTLLGKRFDTTSIKLPVEPAANEKPAIILASATIDTLWEDNKEIILKLPDGSLDVRRKFNPTKKFGDFWVAERFKGKPVAILDFSTSKYGKLYKTASKKAIEKGPVFAGHFAFARVDCGTGCYASTIIDLKTGKVYDGPHASSGYQYKINSRLLVINPPQADGFYTPCDYCEPELYLWTGKSFKKIE